VDSAHPAVAAVALEAAVVVVTVAAVSVVATVMEVAAEVVVAAALEAVAEAVEAVIKPTFPADLAIGNAPSLTAETLTSLGEMNVTNVKPLNPKVLEVTLEAEGVVDSVAAAAEVAVEAVASVVATVMEVAAAADSAAVVAAVTEEVAVAEDSAVVIVEAAAEVDSVAAVVVAAAVPCVEAVEADTETVPIKHPTISMLQENSTKQYSRSHAHHKNFYKVCHAPYKQYSRRSQALTFSTCPRFFSAAVEMSDQYFLT